MKTINWEANDSSKDLAKPDQLSVQQLQAMQLVAKMREAADRAGTKFIGGFITPNGERFVSSNLDESSDVINNIIGQMLEQGDD